MRKYQETTPGIVLLCGEGDRLCTQAAQFGRVVLSDECELANWLAMRAELSADIQQELPSYGWMVVITNPYFLQMWLAEEMAHNPENHWVVLAELDWEEHNPDLHGIELVQQLRTRMDKPVLAPILIVSMESKDAIRKASSRLINAVGHAYTEMSGADSDLARFINLFDSIPRLHPLNPLQLWDVQVNYCTPATALSTLKHDILRAARNENAQEMRDLCTIAIQTAERLDDPILVADLEKLLPSIPDVGRDTMLALAQEIGYRIDRKKGVTTDQAISAYRASILMLDDDPEELDALRTALLEYGVDLLHVKTVAEARQLLNYDQATARRIMLVACDFRLFDAGTDDDQPAQGYDLLREISQTDYWYVKGVIYSNLNRWFLYNALERFSIKIPVFPKQDFRDNLPDLVRHWVKLCEEQGEWIVGMPQNSAWRNFRPGYAWYRLSQQYEQSEAFINADILGMLLAVEEEKRRDSSVKVEDMFYKMYWDKMESASKWNDRFTRIDRDVRTQRATVQSIKARRFAIVANNLFYIEYEDIWKIIWKKYDGKETNWGTKFSEKLGLSLEDREFGMTVEEIAFLDDARERLDKKRIHQQARKEIRESISYIVACLRDFLKNYPELWPTHWPVEGKLAGGKEAEVRIVYLQDGTPVLQSPMAVRAFMQLIQGKVLEMPQKTLENILNIEIIFSSWISILTRIKEEKIEKEATNSKTVIDRWKPIQPDIKGTIFPTILQNRIYAAKASLRPWRVLPDLGVKGYNFSIMDFDEAKSLYENLNKINMSEIFNEKINLINHDKRKSAFLRLYDAIDSISKEGVTDYIHFWTKVSDHFAASKPKSTREKTSEAATKGEGRAIVHWDSESESDPEFIQQVNECWEKCQQFDAPAGTIDIRTNDDGITLMAVEKKEENEELIHKMYLGTDLSPKWIAPYQTHERYIVFRYIPRW